MERIKEVLDNMSVNYEIKDKNALVEFWTDKAGQDIPVKIEYDGTPEDFVKKFTEYAERYDVVDEVDYYVDMRGKNGVPDTVRGLIDGCQEAKDTLMELSENLKKAIMDETTATRRMKTVADLDLYDDGGGLCEIINMHCEDGEIKSLTIRWITFTTCYECQRIDNVDEVYDQEEVVDVSNICKLDNIHTEDEVFISREREKNKEMTMREYAQRHSATDKYGIKPLSERISVSSGENQKTLYTAIVFYSEEGVTEKATFETEKDAAIECKNLYDRAVKAGEMTEDIKSTSWNDGVYAGRIDWDDGEYTLFDVISSNYYSSKVCNEYLCKEYDEARLAKED